jgi:cell division transport system permease protein
MRGYGPFYFLSEAIRGLFSNILVNLLAIGTISMAMLIVGLFLVVFFNVRSAVNTIGNRLEMSVYLKDGLTQREKDYLLDRIKKEPGVMKAVFMPKDQALELFKKELKGQETLVQGLGENPLPDSFELTIDRSYAGLDRIEVIAKNISSSPGVDDVSYAKQGAELIAKLYKLLAYGGTALAILLGVSVVFIISNSVRLALYSRGQEIELMQWIGATRGFIQGPFLIEGTLIAMIGATLAVGVMAVLYSALPSEVVALLSRSNGLDFLPPVVVAYMIIGGGLLGLAGGLVSVSRFLE